ncbi:MAG: hypothetical protein PHZ09_09280 [Eubacteriales bacterium]|nr:hypothetical protein [Eubacteriales bacterium]
MPVFKKRTAFILLFILGLLFACGTADPEEIASPPAQTEDPDTAAAPENLAPPAAVTTADLAPPAVAVPEEPLPAGEAQSEIYADDLDWYINDDIAALDFAEMYISASAKRTDRKFEGLRDPEIRLLHLVGDNGAREINDAIDKAITEPYAGYISQIQGGDYTDDNLFVCQSHVALSDSMAVVTITFFVYAGTAATEANSESVEFLYDYNADRLLTVSDVLASAGVDDAAFLNSLNDYANRYNNQPETYTAENINWLLPTATGITVNMHTRPYYTYPETFTIPYTVLGAA